MPTNRGGFYVRFCLSIGSRSQSQRQQCIARQHHEVTVYQEQQRVSLGPITAHHIAVHRARQADSTALTIPTDNTTRQAQALDVELLRLEQQQGETQEDEDSYELDVQVFGTWVKIPVRVSSLRAALRLPQHDIFSRGISTGSRSKWRRHPRHGSYHRN